MMILVIVLYVSVRYKIYRKKKVRVWGLNI